MSKGITKDSLLLIVPPALKYDKSIMALAEADAEVLEARLNEIDQARIISNIDSLPEAVLDILAKDFKVDWWDPQYSIEEKRRTLKDSWRVHKMLGTKAAVETAISAIYPETKVEEWFEYEGGKPYHFRLKVQLAMDDNDVGKRKRVLDRVNFYKSLRSHNDGVEYSSTFPELSKKVYVTPHRCETRMITALPELHPVTEHRCAVYATPYLGRAMAITRLPQLEPAHGPVRGRLRFGAGAMTIMQTRLPMLRRTPENEEETQ